MAQPKREKGWSLTEAMPPLEKPAAVVALPTDLSGGEKHAGATAAAATGGHGSKKKRMPIGEVMYFLEWEKKLAPRPTIPNATLSKCADQLDKFNDEIAEYAAKVKDEYLKYGYVEYDAEIDDDDDAEIDDDADAEIDDADAAAAADDDDIA